jgi:thiol-disulfide isomerase/thioredoxin
MRIKFLQTLLCGSSIFCSLSLFSQTPAYSEPVVHPAIITKDLMTWLFYERDYMDWSADFISLDTFSNQITKGDFLAGLTTGNYLPLRIKTKNDSLCYQLYKLENSIDNEIGRTIKYKAQTEYRYYKMEGQPLPKLDFVDLEGNRYDKETTDGKILVLKCWFIRCRPCIEEMPRLNKLVKEYKYRDDILFVSLAFDSDSELINFLKKTTFRYKTVADKKDYLINDLTISGYPTHLIINKEGKIVKIIENVDKMISLLSQEVLK